MYECWFKFKGKLYNTAHSGGIHLFKDGFWVDDAMSWTNGNNAKYWIPPTMIQHIEKLVLGPIYCDTCKYLIPTEEEQTDEKEQHTCSALNIILYHRGQHPHIPRPLSCTQYENRENL
jgi:hypothetical protein